jgi:hypothetical protein
MERRLCLLGIFLALATIARADEIHLKDGSKIVGTIVDYEDESFKVQTAYGFAMVRKDSIAQIIPSEPSKPSDLGKAAPAPAVAGASATPSASKPEPAIHAASMAMPAPNPRRKPVVAPTVAAPAPAAAPPAANVAAVVPAPAPPAPLVPSAVRDVVQGNLYINQTYNFQLYRPPGWDLMSDARKAMPNAITAMGTTDQTTLFVVGRETLRDSLEAHAANAERALRQIYENYRPGSSTKLSVSGVPAVEWRFRGMADGHDWSVTALTIAHGTDVFTLLGMTSGDSDLIQIRENVIAKMISSVAFTSAP